MPNGRSPGSEADHIRSQEELNALTKYCWFNPVKHGLVRRPADGPCSSFHRDARLGRGPVGWQGGDVEVEIGEWCELSSV